MKKIKIFPLVIAVIVMHGCRKDQDPPATPPPPVNEEEVITSLILTFTDAEPNQAGVNETFTLRFTDVDGPGGQPPSIEADAIPTGRFYHLTTRVLNESVSPPVDLTTRIVDEGADHQFFYSIEGVNMVITDLNTDVNGYPLGTTANAQTLAAGQGTLSVVRIHEPDKDAPGVAEGDISQAGGEVDIEAEFPLVIY
jgi:hypothetical protein